MRYSPLGKLLLCALLCTVTTTCGTGVLVFPQAATVSITQSQRFIAVRASGDTTHVSWLVNGKVGGDAINGTISSDGVYTAPAEVPSPEKITITAKGPTHRGSATVTIWPASVTTYHNDNGRTGQNIRETTLTVRNVNQTTFGKLYSIPLDGPIHAQPLYVPHVAIPNQGFHDVVYVATEHDTVYAFDADAPTSNPLWSDSFISAAQGISAVPSSDVNSPFNPEVGITSTPVIDLTSRTLYVVAATKESGKYFHRLHAIDLASGAEKFGGPVILQGSVQGTGWGNIGGIVTFDSKIQLQRSALLLSDGRVYIAWASYGDLGSYHGWVMCYDARTLHQLAVWNSTPNGGRGGIWEAGAGLSADTSGNVYLTTGNGSFENDAKDVDFGDSFVKLSNTSKGLIASDYFTPFNQDDLYNFDIDLGSSGFVILPDQPGPVPHIGISAGKEGKIYLINLDKMGKFQSGSDSQIVQSLPNAIGTSPTENNFSTAVYWRGNIYYSGNHDVTKQFQLSNGLLSTTPVFQGSAQYNYTAASSISSYGASDGILWTVDAGINTLYAYDATNVSTELYDSNQAGTRDQFGRAVNFTVPTVIDGKVYVAGQGQLTVFGLFP